MVKGGEGKAMRMQYMCRASFSPPKAIERILLVTSHSTTLSAVIGLLTPLVAA